MDGGGSVQQGAKPWLQTVAGGEVTTTPMLGSWCPSLSSQVAAIWNPGVLQPHLGQSLDLESRVKHLGGGWEQMSPGIRVETARKACLSALVLLRYHQAPSTSVPTVTTGSGVVSVWGTRGGGSVWLRGACGGVGSLWVSLPCLADPKL